MTDESGIVSLATYSKSLGHLGDNCPEGVASRFKPDHSLECKQEWHENIATWRCFHFYVVARDYAVKSVGVLIDKEIGNLIPFGNYGVSVRISPRRLDPGVLVIFNPSIPWYN